MVVVQLPSRVWLFATPWTTTCQPSLSFPIFQGFLKLMSNESVMPSNYFILCHPLLLLPSVFPIIRVFSNESALCIRWPKYWSFNFSISPSNEYSELISFRIDWFDFLGFPGTQMVKNLPAMQRPGFDSWVRKIFWRREWLPTPIFWPGKLHG